MLERIKNGVLAVGVCYPCYLLAYGTFYFVEPLLVDPDRRFATGTMTAIAGMAVLRIIWLFVRAAVRGRPVFELPPERDVTAPILGLGPVRDREEPVDRAAAEYPAPHPQGRPRPAVTILPAGAQRA